MLSDTIPFPTVLKKKKKGGKTFSLSGFSPCKKIKKNQM